jgi:hypothetical protein
MTADSGALAGKFIVRSVGWGLLTAIACCTVAINQSAVHYREIRSDDELFAYYGWCVTQGARPYVDFWDNKPPMIFWANAAARAMTPHGWRPEMVVGFASLAATVLLLGTAAGALFGRAMAWMGVVIACVLLSDVRFECGANRTEALVLLFEVAAVALYASFRRNGTLAMLIAAGAAVGCAPLCKQAGIAAGLACAVDLAWQYVAARSRQRRLRFARCGAIFVTSAAAPAALVALILAMQGALADAWFAVFTFNRMYFEVGDASWLDVPKAIALYATTLTPIVVWVAAGAVSLGLAISLDRVNSTELQSAERAPDEPISRRSAAVLVSVWLLASLYLATVGPGRQAYHLMPSLAPLAIAPLAAVSLMWGTRSIPDAVQQAARMSIVVLGLIALLLPIARGNAAAVAQCWQRKTSPFGDWRVSPQDQQQGDWIRANTEPDAKVYVWGWSPGTYRHAERLPAARFATLEKLGALRGQAEFMAGQAIESIRAAPPEIFVASPRDFEGIRAGRAEFAEWITRRYDRLMNIEGMDIWRLRDRQ